MTFAMIDGKAKFRETDIDTWKGIEFIPQDRFGIASDDSGHEYFIPVSRMDDWYKWLDSGDDLEEPDYASRIDGTFTFTDPRCE